jgi:hypothetical protein
MSLSGFEYSKGRRVGKVEVAMEIKDGVSGSWIPKTVPRPV